MYGAQIGIRGKGRRSKDEFVIRHECYGKIFSKERSSTMPYIEPNWGYKFNNDDEINYI
jgi:hypothetical protein